TPPASVTPPAPRAATPVQAARADSVRHSFTAADVEFVTGMIHHHAQALIMAGMAPTHGASPALRILAERIINGQRDEIALMQTWLRDHGQSVPEPGHIHAMHMPGMLTPEQMAELYSAHGPEWDRLFLTYMIQHHRGALTMVDDLFSIDGAGQGDRIFKLASDIGADQASEIDRMQSMLYDMVFVTGNLR
ncbi:MAG: DUF305 domain-containing protein, partial [Longimicrobiales bacterium]